MIWKTSFLPPQSRLLAVALVFILVIGVVACDVVDIEEEKARDSVPDIAAFPGIMSILTTPINTPEGSKTCSAANCHRRDEGSGGLLRIVENPDPEELCTNYLSVIAFVNLNEPASSKFLLEPLAGTTSSTGTHSGGDIFTTNSTEYQTILAWISNPVLLSNPKDPCAQ